MKRLCIIAFAAAAALAASAQVKQSELAGKYHLQAHYDLWEGITENDVYALDDFTFSLEDQGDGTFRLYSFFYNGMNEQFERLGYGATAEYSPAEQLLYVYQTPWLWDEYMGKFMESYGYGQGDGPMMYFQVQKDPKTGVIKLASTENSLGFYYQSYYQGQSAFIYAIDYPGVVSATKKETYASVKAADLPGEYTMSYTDAAGRKRTTNFTIAAGAGGAYTLTGIFGSKKTYDVHLDADGRGFYIPLERTEQGGYYVSYFGSNVGDCRVAFSYDAEGRLVADNYFSYSPDFRNWTDAFDAVATKQVADGISNVTVNCQPTNGKHYDLQGRPAAGRTGIVIRNGRKQYVK